MEYGLLVILILIADIYTAATAKPEISHAL
jgi:hypothetical protein